MTPQLLRFGLVGVANTLIGFSAIALLGHVIGLHAVAANIGGFLIGGACSYLLNKVFTFRNRRPHRSVLPRFLLLVGLCFGLNILVLVVVVDALELHPLAAQACAVLVYNVGFYAGSKFVVFRE